MFPSIIAFILRLQVRLLERIHTFILGSRVRLVHRESTLLLHVPCAPTSPLSSAASTTRVQFHEYIAAACPTLTRSKYAPTPWLFNAHLQTYWATKVSYETRYPVAFTREVVKTPDGGTIALDWAGANPDSFRGTGGGRVLVVLHGLTGGSHESYLRSLLHCLTTNPPNIDGRGAGLSGSLCAVVTNFRGCAQTPLTSTQLYCGGYTDDLRLNIAHIRSRVGPNARIGVIGFSLGANILVKYLGEEGSNAGFDFAMSVANPYDLHISMLAMERSWLGRIYQRVMCGSLKRLFLRHLEILKDTPEIDAARVLTATTTREFDQYCTAPAFGYDTVTHYYRDASSGQYIPRVRIPLLCLLARDDPICDAQAIPYEEVRYNPHVLLAELPSGGHLGWFEGWWRPERWCTLPLAEFCVAMFAVDKCERWQDGRRAIPRAHASIVDLTAASRAASESDGGSEMGGGNDWTPRIRPQRI